MKAFPSLPWSLPRSLIPSLLTALIRTANECGTFLTVRFRYRVRRHRQAPGVRARRHDRRRRRGSGEIEGGGEERRGMAAAAADCHMLPYCGEGGDGEGSLPRQLLYLIPPFLPSSLLSCLPCMTTDGRRRSAAGDHCHRPPCLRRELCVCACLVLCGENISVIGRDLRKRHLPNLFLPRVSDRRRLLRVILRRSDHPRGRRHPLLGH